MGCSPSARHSRNRLELNIYIESQASDVQIFVFSICHTSQLSFTHTWRVPSTPTPQSMPNSDPSAPNSTATQPGCRNHPQFHPAYDLNQMPKRRSTVHPSHVAVGVHIYAGNRLIRPKRGWALGLGNLETMRGQKKHQKGSEKCSCDENKSSSGSAVIMCLKGPIPGSSFLLTQILRRPPSRNVSLLYSVLSTVP